MSTVVSDNFNRASLGSNWTIINDTPTISSNQLTGSVSSGENLAYWSNNEFPKDHWSEITYSSVNDGGGPCVRLNSGPTGYIFYTDSVNLQIYRMDTGPSFTLLGGLTGSLNLNDVMRLEARGSTLEGFINGVSRGTVIDSNHGSGYPGVHIYDNLCLFDNWSGGVFGSPILIPGGVFSG